MATARLSVVARRFSTTSRVQAGLIKPPIPAFGIEGRYATALYSAASKEKKLEATETELKRLKDLLHKDVKLAEFIANPLIKKTTKRDGMKAALQKEKFGNLTINLIVALAENARLTRLESVINTFSTIMSAYRGEVTCEITTAKALDQAQLKDVEAALQGFLKKGEKLMINTKVDPSLIGGMVVSIGDKYIDMSMSSKIKTYSSLIAQSI